jgi:hypothetical protein
MGKRGFVRAQLRANRAGRLGLENGRSASLSAFREGGNRVRRSWLRLFWAAVVVAGAAIAYLVTSEFGARLVHDEIEDQLSRRLGGPVEIAEVAVDWREGISIDARGLEAFPSTEADAPAALRASRVHARLDLLALLVGRLELAALVIEGPRLRIEQAADGSIANLPLPPPAPEEPPPSGPAPSLFERWALSVEGLHRTATGLLERVRIADRIEIVDGTIAWVELGATDGEQGASAPSETRLELLSGSAEREWLDGGVTIDLRAVVVDGVHPPFSVELSVRRDDDDAPITWTAAWSGLPLERFETTPDERGGIGDLAGRADAHITLTTNAFGRSVLRMEGSARDVTIALPARDTTFSSDHLDLRVAIEIDERGLRVTEGRLGDDRLAVEFKGIVDRPLRDASRARIESRMVGVGVEDLRNFASRLEGDSDLALGLGRLVDRIESGRIRYIETAGTARVRRWRDLLTGQLRALPDGFLLGGALEDVTLGSADSTYIEGLSGELEWAQDQVTLRDMHGRYNGRELPEMNAMIHGVSHLIRAPEAARALHGNYAPLPGLSPLIEILEPRDPDALPPVKALAVAIDRLDHPVLRYPLRDVRMLIEPLRGGVEINVREGTWAGAAVSGDLVWTSGQDRSHVDAQLVLGPPPAGGTGEADPSAGGDTAATSEPSDPAAAGDTASAVAAPAAPEALAEDRWGEGRFEVQFRPSPQLPFRRGLGYFRLAAAQLALDEVEIELDPQGKAALRTRVDLREPDAIGLDLSFAITGARMEGMNEFVALPADLVTGDAGATGSLAGPVRPGASFVAELDGRIRVDVESGRLEMGLPLLLRLSKATEGYNPFAKADEVEFESLGTTIGFDHGVLVSEDFEVEGPLRIFANAELDTNPSPVDIRAVVGVFLFRTSSQFIGNFPLVRSFLPGSERGLLGAYFDVDGPVDDPEISALTTKTLMTAVPDAIKAPFKVLGILFGRSGGDS